MAKPWTEIARSLLKTPSRCPNWWDLSVLAGIAWDRMLVLKCGHEPTLDEARRIARALGCKLDDLWGDHAGAETKIALHRDSDAETPYGLDSPEPTRAELLAMRLVMQIAKDIGPLTALSNLIATHRYHSEEKQPPCSNTSASAPASTAAPSASPVST